MNNRTIKIEVDTPEGVVEEELVVRAIDFDIDDQAIESEIRKSSQVIPYYAYASSRVNTYASQLKHKLDSTAANIAEGIRATGNPKPTEARIKDLIVIHPEYEKAHNKYLEAKEVQMFVDNAWKGYIKKLDLLVTLSYRQNAELKKVGGVFS